MKENVLTKFILTLILGTIITTSSIISVTTSGEPPQPEMAAIEYNINI